MKKCVPLFIAIFSCTVTTISTLPGRDEGAGSSRETGHYPLLNTPLIDCALGSCQADVAQAIPSTDPLGE